MHKRLIHEFKKFLSRGNVLDLAVAVVMGAAFTSIVNSTVNDILMPILGIFLGGVNFSKLDINIGQASIKYGNFIQAIFNFLIISMVIFMFVKALNELQQKLLGIKKDGAHLSPELKMLTEIRNLLKKQVKDSEK